MEDFDFDQLFSDKMRQSGAPDLSAADWHQLSGRLDEFDRQRHRVFPMWWLAALTGLLLLSNLGWWAVWQNTSHKQEQLATEWQQIRQHTTVQMDTVVNRTVVYVYDTIRTAIAATAPKMTNNTRSIFEHPLFTSSVLTKKSGNNAKDKSLVTNGASQNEGKTAVESELISGQIVPSSNAIQIINTDSPDNKKVTDALITQIPNLEMPTSLMRKTPHLPVQPITDLPSIVKKAPTVLSRRHPNWGITASSMHALSPSIILSGGVGAGVMGEIPVTNHIGMIFHADFAGIRLRGYTLDPSLGLPTPHSPGSEFDFKYFETHDGPKPVLSLGAGTRYWLLPDKTFSPYLGLGYVAQWNPEYRVEMEFINHTTGLEKSKDIEVDDEGLPVSMLDLNLGGRVSLTRHVQLQAGGYYQIKLNPERRGIPRYIGLKAAFLYEL